MKRLLLLFAILLIAASVHAQNLITNGDFQNGMTGWSVAKSPTSAPVYFGIISDPIQMPPGNIGPAAGLFTNDVGIIDTWIYAQVSGLTIGLDYTISADYAGQVLGSGSTFASWEVGLIPGIYNANSVESGQYDFSRRTASTMPTVIPWETASSTFTAVNTTCTFYMRAGIYPATYSSFGAYLDNVSLTPVPEPSSLLALGTGVLGLTGMIIRRRIK